jgi:hypothetical protein
MGRNGFNERSIGDAAARSTAFDSVGMPGYLVSQVHA